MYTKENIEDIAEAIRKVMDKHNIKNITEPVNYYRTIKVSNSATKPENNLYIWIRLLYNKTISKYIAEISNIEIPVKSRQKGVFTDLYKSLLNCKLIDEVRITSVCTREMKNWCDKHRLKSYNAGTDYTSKVS